MAKALTYADYSAKGVCGSRDNCGYGCEISSAERHIRAQYLLRKFRAVADMVGLVAPASFESHADFEMWAEEELSPESRLKFIEAAEKWLSDLKAVEGFPWKELKHPTKWRTFADDVIYLQGIPGFKDFEYGPLPPTNDGIGYTYNLYRGSVPQPEALIGLLFKFSTDWWLGHPACRHRHGN